MTDIFSHLSACVLCKDKFAATMTKQFPPPTICAQKWRKGMLDTFPNIKLTLLVRNYAQKWHISTNSSVQKVVREWRAHLPHQMPLPHLSWRNTTWIKKNSWFEAEVIPALRRNLKEVLS